MLQILLRHDIGCAKTQLGIAGIALVTVSIHRRYEEGGQRGTSQNIKESIIINKIILMYLYYDKGPQIEEIVRILRPLIHRWFSFGIQLGIEIANLRIIEARQYKDPERNLIDVIDCWMTRTSKYDRRIWTALAEAIERMDAFHQLSSDLKLKAMQEEHPSQTPTRVRT